MNTNTISGISPWPAPASEHGSGLPFAGYGMKATATAAAHTTLAARKDDAQVPEPRGRQR